MLCSACCFSSALSQVLLSGLECFANRCGVVEANFEENLSKNRKRNEGGEEVYDGVLNQKVQVKIELAINEFID